MDRKHLKTVAPPLFLQYYRGMRVLVSLRSIYRDREFLMVFFVGLGDIVIGHKKIIETEKRKRIKSEKIKIYDDKKGIKLN